MHIDKIVSEDGAIINYQLIGSDGSKNKTVNDFLAFLKIKNYSPNTLKNYAFDLKCYFMYLTEVKKPYYAIDPQDLVKFLEYLNEAKSNNGIYGLAKNHLAPSTVKRILAAISSFYDWLQVVDPNPKIFRSSNLNFTSGSYKSFLSFAKKHSQTQSRFITVKLPKRLPRPVPQEHVSLLLQSLKTWRDKAIIFLGLQGGMRIGEILGLCFEDIHFRKKEIMIRFRANNPNQVRLKGMRERKVYIEEPEALFCLNQYILHERLEQDCPYVFLSQKGITKGKPLTYQGIYTVMAYHCQKLGISKDFTLHLLRHTHATKMYEKGMGLLSLQKRLGHASPHTTQIYTQISDQKLKEDYLNALNKQ